MSEVRFPVKRAMAARGVWS